MPPQCLRQAKINADKVNFPAIWLALTLTPLLTPFCPRTVGNWARVQHWQIGLRCYQHRHLQVCPRLIRSKFAHLLLYYWAIKLLVLKTPFPPLPKTGLENTYWVWRVVTYPSDRVEYWEQRERERERATSPGAELGVWQLPYTNLFLCHSRSKRTSVRVTLICMWSLGSHRSCVYSWSKKPWSWPPRRSSSLQQLPFQRSLWGCFMSTREVLLILNICPSTALQLKPAFKADQSSTLWHGSWHLILKAQVYALKKATKWNQQTL